MADPFLDPALFPVPPPPHMGPNDDVLWSQDFSSSMPLFAPPSPSILLGSPRIRARHYDGSEVRCFYGCDPVFMNEEQLQQHVLMQHEISRCQYGCEPSFDRFESLRQHVREQHLAAAAAAASHRHGGVFQPMLSRGVPDINCFYGCDPTFQDEIELREHVRQQHEISRCLYGCDPRFDHFDELRDHMSQAHAFRLHPVPGAAPGTLTDQVGNMYTCHYDSCGRAFPVLTQLAQHRVVMHNESSAPPVLTTTTTTLGSDMTGGRIVKGEGTMSPDIPPAHRCGKCGSTFNQENNLERHQKSAHQGKKDHVCEYCHTPFGRKSNLKTHIDTVHFQKRRFACDKCGQRFTQKGNLATHFRTKHLGRRDFSCEQCGQTFARNETRRVHYRIVHEKRKDFLCTHCPNKGFATKSNLVRHVRAHHGEQVLNEIVKPKQPPIVLESSR